MMNDQILSYQTRTPWDTKAKSLNCASSHPSLCPHVYEQHHHLRAQEKMCHFIFLIIPHSSNPSHVLWGLCSCPLYVPIVQGFYHLSLPYVARLPMGFSDSSFPIHTQAVAILSTGVDKSLLHALHLCRSCPMTTWADPAPFISCPMTLSCERPELPQQSPHCENASGHVPPLCPTVYIYQVLSQGMY